MNHEIENQEVAHHETGQPAMKSSALPVSIVIAAVILAGAWVYKEGPERAGQGEMSPAAAPTLPVSELEEAVLPRGGVVLPVRWGDLGAKLVSTGVIDEERFKALYTARGAFTPEHEQLLTGQSSEPLVMTEENAGFLLNLFWALGLASKNPILDSGEMTNPAYGGAENFASTGGWTIARGSAMDHYSRHLFFNLTPEQQRLVDKVSRGIYRPCCGNSTHFPDCNHGMAMLGLLELMASQGISEEDMWKTALTVNSYWFPDTYLTIAAYKKSKGVDWKDVEPKEVLGASYSSATGYARIASQVIQAPQGGASDGCGVNAGGPVTPSGGGSGCGI